jgi:hypothetical protein
MRPQLPSTAHQPFHSNLSQSSTMELKRMASKPGFAHYDWPTTSTCRPQETTRPPSFYLLKARCAPIALSFQGRRTDQPPFFFPGTFLQEIAVDRLGTLIIALNLSKPAIERQGNEKLPHRPTMGLFLEIVCLPGLFCCSSQGAILPLASSAALTLTAVIKSIQLSPDSHSFDQCEIQILPSTDFYSHKPRLYCAQ